jgi:hypothetical protein
VDEFIWARLVVITRVFGLVINGVKTTALVPLADMMNHLRPAGVCHSLPSSLIRDNASSNVCCAVVVVVGADGVDVR